MLINSISINPPPSLLRWGRAHCGSGEAVAIA